MSTGAQRLPCFHRKISHQCSALVTGAQAVQGWMQTWLVHMRQPVTLWRQLGPGGFMAFQLLVGGNALAALVHPLFAGALVISVLRTGELIGGGDITLIILSALYVAAAAFGYLSSAFLGWLGLSRRNLLPAAWVLFLTPLHWLMLSWAAWRALHQLFAAPFAWEKTEHGLARTSHRATGRANALVQLDSDLRDAKENGALPVINAPLTDTSSSRRRSLRASA